MEKTAKATLRAHPDRLAAALEAVDSVIAQVEPVAEDLCHVHLAGVTATVHAALDLLAPMIVPGSLKTDAAATAAEAPDGTGKAHKGRKKRRSTSLLLTVALALVGLRCCVPTTQLTAQPHAESTNTNTNRHDQITGSSAAKDPTATTPTEEKKVNP